MPQTRAAVREKLGNHPISKLEDRYQRNVYLILEEIAREQNQDGFAKSSSVRKFGEWEGIWDRVVYEILDYLGRMGYVRVWERIGTGSGPRKIEILPEGRKELLSLHELLNPLKKDVVSLYFSSGGKEYKVDLKIDGKNISKNVEMFSILLTPEVLETVRKAIHSLISSTMQSNFTFSIEANLPSIVRSPVMCMMLDMVKYFERAKRTALSLLRPQDYKDRYGLLSPEDLSDRVLYRRFFELKLQAAAKLFKDWGPNDTVNYLGLPDSLVSQLEDSKARSWIVERLKVDPNFFMPHLCWVKLGFPEKGESSEEIEATPPSMDALLCYPSLEAKIVRLTEILEAAIEKQERNELFEELKPKDAKVLREKFEKGREESELQEAYNVLYAGIMSFDLDRSSMNVGEL